MIALGTWGWTHAAWNGSFYAEDLPPEWRLTFYSNEFDAVAVAVDDWLSVPLPDLHTWVEDTRETFRLHLELPTSEAVEAKMKSRLEALAPRLGAFIAYADTPAAVLASAHLFAPVVGVGACEGLPEIAGDLLGALEDGRAPMVWVAGEPDLRAARKAMETLGPKGRATFLVRGDAPEALARLHSLRTLRDLMGWQ